MKSKLVIKPCPEKRDELINLPNREGENMNSKLQTLQGMHDRLPENMKKRQWVIQRITSVFEKYGFEPMETPAIEYWEILSGKDVYGDEEKLIYKFQDRGRRDVGMRFDFTVPLARVVSSYPDITMPFKRYQIQTVWRCDKPQYGRFREFYQCDVDIVGTESVIAEAELIILASEIFEAIGFKKFMTKINSRKLLQTICEYSGVDKSKEFELFRAMDKRDRIGIDGVKENFEVLGLSKEAKEKIISSLGQPIAQLEKLLPNKEGIAQVRTLFSYLENLGCNMKHIMFDPWLSRGFDYYTGPIFETIIEGTKVGSVAGGGRYDNLIGKFNDKDIPAVGISIGLERVLMVMDKLDMNPKIASPVKFLVTLFDEPTIKYALQVAKDIRNSGVGVEVYPEAIKIGKQFKYASKKKIPFVVIAGPDELKTHSVAIKDMKSGTQETLKLAKLNTWLQKKLEVRK